MTKHDFSTMRRFLEIMRCEQLEATRLNVPSGFTVGGWRIKSIRWYKQRNAIKSLERVLGNRTSEER